MVRITDHQEILRPPFEEQTEKDGIVEVRRKGKKPRERSEEKERADEERGEERARKQERSTRSRVMREARIPLERTGEERTTWRIVPAERPLIDPTRQ